VLQAMILTDKEKMLLTPTYHVYKLYTVHHDATLLPSELQCADYTFEENKIPGLNVSASKDKEGRIHVTLCNLNPNSPAELACELQGVKAGTIKGQVLTAQDMQAHNTFELLNIVPPTEFKDFKANDGGFTATLPAKSVVLLALE
jgi:alpha-N-arabinofuranosidase